MKRWAFILLASVIGSQLLLIAAVIAGCFYFPSPKCTGEKMSELMNIALVNSFALYAAEK